MSFDAIFPELLKVESGVDANKILDRLLDESHIDVKTHILNPMDLAILDAYIKFLSKATIQTKKNGLKQTSDFLTSIITQYKKYMVSWNRLSRKEVTNVLASVREQQRQDGLFQKLVGAGGKQKNE